jgi:hypothetical protein
MIESLSNREIIRLAEEANQGGEYEAARNLLNREMIRRGIAIQALHTVDMPVVDANEETLGERVERWVDNPPTSRAWTDLDDGELIVRGDN